MPQAIPTNPRFQDLTGRRFHRVQVEAYAGVKLTGKRTRIHYWHCRCSCRTKFTTCTNNLVSGHTKSCGCYHADAIAARNFKHGYRHTPTYTSWAGMLSRCNDPNCRSYSDYGGRGIRVCRRWQDREHGFSNFVSDMGLRPRGTTLDRKRVNEDYGPGNCRWATPKEQARNKRTNRLLTAGGRTQCLAAWAEELGLSVTTLSGRLKTWSLYKALTTPRMRPSRNA